ncbi:hypothetical protein [Micrococcus luteus]|uniref:hypothetical protein n=1 Tax=Micrococcus luteus TaxID=1270 RepID=UPI003446B2B6
MASTDDTQAASPFGRRWLISGAVVLLALALAVFLAVRGGSDKQPEGSPSPAVSAPSAGASTPTAETAQAKCKTPESKDKGIPSKAPAVTWERHPSGGVVPVSKDHGPTIREGNAWRCASHTASGAVLSGMSLVYNFSTGDKLSAAEGPHREDMFARNQYGPNTEFGTVEGYRILLATESDAEVEYLLSGAGALGVMRVPMVWDANKQDWALNSHSNDLGVSIVQDRSGFTTWR